MDPDRSFRGRARAWALSALVLAASALAVVNVASAQDTRAPSATDVEAAYLVNFLRYTQWPARTLEGPGAPYVITVVGPATVAERVRAVAAAAGPVEGRPIEVRRLAWQRGSQEAPLDSERDREAAEQLRSSHLVFFHVEAGRPHARVLADLWGQPVLTVGNARGFTDRGGMLGLVRRGSSIVFEANPGAIRNANLTVSAKVLKLARNER